MQLTRTRVGPYALDVISTDLLGQAIDRDRSWEPHITHFLARNLGTYDVFVDVGSSYGVHVLHSSALCRRVYSFEPQKSIHELQKNNLQLNGITNVELFNMGLGNENGLCELAPIDYGCRGNAGDVSIGQGGERIEVRTIDSLSFEYVSHMKIDVQGYEKFVLEGGQETMTRCKPMLIVEFEDQQLAKFQYDSRQLFELIRNMGYFIYLLDYSYPSDHVCVHRDNMRAFLQKNVEWIRPLTERNSINQNLSSGVVEKIIR